MMTSLSTVSHSMFVLIGRICFASAARLTDLCRCCLLWLLLLICSHLPAFFVLPNSVFRKSPDLRFCSLTGSPAVVTIVNRLRELYKLSHLLPTQSLLHGSQLPLYRKLCLHNSFSFSRSESMCFTTAKRPFIVYTQQQADTDGSNESHISLFSLH
ncbi:Uncharacterized protein Rs2_21360 [Raphanus sativus]|nr:Uncharacterized protein Rs2_21360 [Raphanus sativus]